jgi:hypothetical protein
MGSVGMASIPCFCSKKIGGESTSLSIFCLSNPTLFVDSVERWWKRRHSSVNSELKIRKIMLSPENLSLKNACA